jgi:hypothetical protein
MKNKFCFDVGINIEGCGIAEKKNSQENKNDLSSTESVKYKRKHIVKYQFKPVGKFSLTKENRKLKENVRKELKELASLEDARSFLDKYGLHYPAPDSMFHYGGVEITFYCIDLLFPG